MSLRKLLKLIASALLPAVLMTAFSVCAYAEPEEGFVQEGDRSPDDLAGPAPEGALTDPGSSPSPDTSVSLIMDQTEETQAAAPVPESGISISFGYGFRNIAKSSRRLPFEAVLHNYDPQDFSGELVLTLPGSIETGADSAESAEIRYSFPVGIPAGEAITVRDLISAGENGGVINIRLYDQDRRLIAEQAETVNIQSSSPELLIGLLSDNPEELGYFRGISVAGTAMRTRTVELDPAGLPEAPENLSQVDMIVISDLDSRRLPDAGIRVIREWVNDGGALLIGTGARPSTAVQLLSNIRDFSLSDADQRDIDMGMKYSKTGPDGAVISLLVRDVSLSSGTQVIQSGDTAILTTVPRGNGIVGVTAYDLCDISAFCTEEIGYVDELLQGLFGTGRISHMAEEDRGTGFYASVRSLVGLTDPERLPSATLYIMFALAYLGLIGFGLYVYLRTRGLGIYYHAFVPIAACAGALVVSVMAIRLKQGDPAADYSVVRELNGGSVSDEGFVRLLSSSGNDFRLKVPEGAAVIPVVREAKTAGLFASDNPDGRYDSRSVLEIRTGAEDTEILTENMKPFAASLLEYSRSFRTEEPGIEAHITAFDEAVNGTVKNNSGHELQNAYLLMYGRIAPVGNIPDGGEAELKDTPLINSPTGSPELLSEYITGIRSMEPGSAEYIRALKNSRLLSWYIDTNLRAYYGGARLIAFIENTEPLLLRPDGRELSGSGTMLLAGFTDTTFAHGAVLWRTALSADPKLISGEYDAAANTTRGTAVLEYSLGSDISIRSLTFCGLSEGFASDRMIPFTGSVYLYNYTTGSYDLMGRGQLKFSAAEIRNYLSPANTLTVRYVPDEGANGAVPMYLPVPDVTGTER